MGIWYYSHIFHSIACVTSGGCNWEILFVCSILKKHPGDTASLIIPVLLVQCYYEYNHESTVHTRFNGNDIGILLKQNRHNRKLAAHRRDRATGRHLRESECFPEDIALHQIPYTNGHIVAVTSAKELKSMYHMPTC